MRGVAILGGGISGLAAAFRLRELARQHSTELEIAVYERSADAGGCMRTLHEDGLVLELGPDSLLVDKPPAANLLRRLHLEDRIVDMRAEFKGARIVHNGRLHRIPPDFRLFTPTSLPALLASGIFSPLGLARAAMEPLIPKRKGTGDESLASFVMRRFGREVLDRLAQPLIGGIYSGDPQRLSMRATLPQFLDLEQRYGSLLRAMQSANSRAAAPRLASLQDGIGSIVEALRSHIGDTIRTSTEVVQLRRESEAWAIGFADGTSAQANAVICALPAYAAASLLREQAPRAAELLDGIRYNSIATVNLAYDSSAAARLPPSTGFVVPFVEQRRITAVTFTTQKYPHRSPDGVMLARAFIGGALQPQLLDYSDDEIARIAHDELTQIAGITAKPKRAVVTRWECFLPEYGVGHVERVREIERLMSGTCGLALAGSAYRGVGIPDCVATGEAGAESAFGYIRAQEREGS